MKYGYARVSTTKQDYKMQEDAIRAAGVLDQHIYTDKKSGKDMEREGWKRLMAAVRPGDSITFYAVSRMSRNADEGTAAYMALVDKGVSLFFIHDQHLNSDLFLQARERKIGAIKTGNQTADTFVNAIVEAVNGFMVDLATDQIRLAFAEAETERLNICQRIKDGMAASGAGEKISETKTGKTLITRKSLEAKELIKKHSRSFGGSLTDPEVMKLAGISRNSYYKYKKELWEEE